MAVLVLLGSGVEETWLGVTRSTDLNLGRALPCSYEICAWSASPHLCVTGALLPIYNLGREPGYVAVRIYTVFTEALQVVSCSDAESLDTAFLRISGCFRSFSHRSVSQPAPLLTTRDMFIHLHLLMYMAKLAYIYYK